MADYYVDKANGNDANPGTFAEPFETIGAALALSAYNDTQIFVANGVYPEGIGLTGTSKDGLLIEGESREGVIIAPYNQHAYYTYRPDNVLRNVTLRVNSPQGSLKYAFFLNLTDCQNFIGENLLIESDPNHYYQGFEILNAGNWLLRGIEFRGRASGSGNFFARIAGGASGKFEGLLSHGNNHLTTALNMSSTGEVTISNSMLIDSGSHGIYQTSGTLNLYNSIIQPGSDGTSVYRGGGVLNESNNILIASPNSPNIHLATGFTPDASDILTVAPKFQSPRGGFCIPHIDDSGNYDYAMQVKDLLAAYNMTGGYYIETALVNEGGSGEVTTAQLQTMLQDGTFEICSHSRTHTNLTYQHALTFTYAGADTNPTVSFDGTTIILATTEGNDDISIPIVTYPIIGADSITDPSNYFSNGIINNFDGVNNWTITKSSSNGQNADSIYPRCQTSGFATQAPTAVPCDIDFDRTGIESGFLRNEVANSKADLDNILGGYLDPQTGQSYQCNSFGWPYDDNSVADRQATIDAGYTNARGSSTDGRLESFDMYSFEVYGYLYIVGDRSEVQIRQRALAIGFYAAVNGYVIPVLGHKPDEITLTEWGWILDEWSKIPGLTVCSPQLFAKYVRDNDAYTDNGDGTFSRQFTRSDENLRQPIDSVGYAAGVAVAGIHDQAALAQDLELNLVHFLPLNIGPVDGRTSKKLTGAYAPTGYDLRGTEDDPATIIINGQNCDLSGLTNDEYVTLKVKTGDPIPIAQGDNQTLKTSGGGGGSFGFGF